MKRLASFALLILLAAVATGCSSNQPDSGDSSLLDMYNDDGSAVTGGDEEVPVSNGPTEIPDDLVIPE